MPQQNKVGYSAVHHNTIHTVQYSTAQRSSTVQHITSRHSKVQHGTVQYSTVQYSTVQYGTLRHITVQAVQHSTAQPSTVVQHITSQHSTWEKSKRNLENPICCLSLTTLFLYCSLLDGCCGLFIAPIFPHSPLPDAPRTPLHFFIVYCIPFSPIRQDSTVHSAIEID
jgi:hypothetical protein